MSLKKFNWKIWFKNEKILEKSFNFYKKKALIKEETETESLSKSHLKKTDYNLDFINFLDKKNNVPPTLKSVGLIQALVFRMLRN